MKKYICVILLALTVVSCSDKKKAVESNYVFGAIPAHLAENHALPVGQKLDDKALFDRIKADFDTLRGKEVPFAYSEAMNNNYGVLSIKMDSVTSNFGIGCTIEMVYYAPVYDTMPVAYKLVDNGGQLIGMGFTYINPADEDDNINIARFKYPTEIKIRRDAEKFKKFDKIIFLTLEEAMAAQVELDSVHRHETDAEKIAAK